MDAVKNSKKKILSSDEVNNIFEDYESRSNLTGFFDLLLKIDRRINPEYYGLEVNDSITASRAVDK